MASLKNLKLIGVFLFIFILGGLVSCNKKSDETSDQKINEAELETVSNEDFTETDEDLLSVDYKEFYDELAPHGEWIEVKGNDIGVDLKKGTSSGHRSISISDLFGVKEAYADVDFGAFFVWQPAPGLAVGLTTGETNVAVQPAYVPYSNGQWINTTNGWYFRAASEPEEITHHYGRWVQSPSLGWVWLPGRVWSPAWVDWREEGDYIAWEPVPPSIYLVNNVLMPPPVYEERYIVVEKRYFVEPEVYRYVYVGNKHKIKGWRRLDGVMVVNQTVINRGPEVSVIQSYYGGTPFGVVTINPVRSISQVSYTSAEYRVFSPEFKKVKTKHKVEKVISTPKKFDKFESASGKYESSKQNKGNIKTDQGKDNKGNENKNSKGNENFKERKYIDDGKMKDGGKNKNNENIKKGNNNNQNKNDGKKNDGNKNDGKKNDGNKNDGKKNDGNKNDGKKNDSKKDGGNKEKIDKKGNDNKSNGKNDKGNKKYRKDQSKDQNKGNDQNKVKDQNKSGNNDKGNKNNGNDKKQNNGSKNKGNKK